MTIQYIKKEFRSIINKYKFIDSWFWCRYSINPYNGCEFACTYCDSRSHKYHLHPEFDQIIYVKDNVKAQLDNRLTRARTLLPDVVALSGTCDPYQPAEQMFKNTRQCLEVLAKHKYPVNIGTKSELVVRDLDILGHIAIDTWCAVSITITTTDPTLARFLEPKAPPPEARFDTVRALKKVDKLQVGVNFMPIVPFLWDSDDQLESMVRNIKAAGADYVLFGAGMTMRDNQAVWWFKRLKTVYPALVDKYLDLYEATMDNDSYQGSYTPNKTYGKRITKKMLELCNKYDISYRMKRFIPNDFRKVNYLLAEEFLNEAYILQYTGKPWTNLFWAGQNIQNLNESIADIALRDELTNIRNVDETLAKRIFKYLEDKTKFTKFF